MEDFRRLSTTSRFSSPGTPKIRSTPSFSKAATRRSDPFIFDPCCTSKSPEFSEIAVERRRPLSWEAFAGTIRYAAGCTFSNRGGPIMVTEARETGSLIGSDKVEGTAVYGANDTKIESIERVMIDKISGRVSYAVLSFGGFLGIGDDHYPLPWQSLKYDTNLGGYRTGLTETQLKGAPKYG